MTEEAGFLDAIAKNPTDTDRRLVFADWLDDNDDFRAEFVRTGLEFDRTPPYESARFDLADRLREILGSRAFEKWLPTHPGLKWGWRRGFLALSMDTAEFPKTDPESVVEFLRTKWIERVRFEGYGQGLPEWERTFALVPNVREAYFGNDDYGVDAIERLAKWPHLRHLRMSYMWGEWSKFEVLPHLRELVLYSPDWTMMPELPRARLPNLEVLEIDKEWNDDLPHWGECFPKLRSLVVEHYNAYPDEQIVRFAECRELRRLALYQRYQPLKRVGLMKLAKLKKLRSLAFGRCPKGSLAPLTKLDKLEHLAVDGIDKPVRGLEELLGLRWLSLTMGPMTEALVTPALVLPQLQRLGLAFSRLEPGSLAVLEKMPTLRILTLSFERKLDESPSLAELERLEQLRYLRIQSYNHSESDIAALRKALPNCRIVTGWRDGDAEGYDWTHDLEG